jgi:phosphatidate cytidylyltransferase
VAASELGRRVAFGLVAAPLAILVVYVGGAPLAALLAIAAALAAWEFFRIATTASYAPLARLGTFIAALIPLAVHAIYLGLLAVPLPWLAAAVLFIFAGVLLTRGPASHPIGATATTVLGIVYTGGMLSFAYALRYHPYAVGRVAGAAFLAFPLVLTWTSDTGGYVVGRAFGRRKLMPSVSPGKTVEGALGAILLCVLVAWAYVRWLLVPFAHLGMSPGRVVLFAVIVSAAVQVGDLCESLIKREAGVKDSSRIIPGHGGVLDRLDGMIFALPVAHLMLTIPHFLQPAFR